MEDNARFKLEKVKFTLKHPISLKHKTLPLRQHVEAVFDEHLYQHMCFYTLQQDIKLMCEEGVQLCLLPTTTNSSSKSNLSIS